MQGCHSRALCQLFASPLYLREAAGARSAGAADPRCAPAAGAGRGVQLCLCSFVQQPCPPSTSTIAHCHTGVLEVIQGETVLHRSRRGAGAMRRSSSCSSCSVQGLCSQCQCCLPAWWALLAHRSKTQSWWEGRDAQRPLHCSTRQDITTHYAHRNQCGHLFWGSAHPQGLLKGPSCAVPGHNPLLTSA